MSDVSPITEALISGPPGMGCVRKQNVRGLCGCVLASSPHQFGSIAPRVGLVLRVLLEQLIPGAQRHRELSAELSGSPRVGTL